MGATLLARVADHGDRAPRVRPELLAMALDGSSGTGAATTLLIASQKGLAEAMSLNLADRSGDLPKDISLHPAGVTAPRGRAWVRR